MSTSLAGTESDLWVGTLESRCAALACRADPVFRRTTRPARPASAVHRRSLATRHTLALCLAWPVFDRGRFSRTLAPGVLATALLPSPGQLLVGSEDQGVIAVPLEARRSKCRLGRLIELGEVRQLFGMGEAVYALTRSGLYRMSRAASVGNQSCSQGAAILSDRNISALATDSGGRLWVGYFDRGLDRLESDHGPVTHIENEHVFCVNRIVPNTKDGTVDVATANGLVRFDAAGNQEQVLTRADGLIADHVTRRRALSEWPGSGHTGGPDISRLQRRA